MNSFLIDAIKVSNDCLAARKAFAVIADSNDWLSGNYNYTDCIGEMVAMRYLQRHTGLQFKGIREHNKSR